MEGGVVEADISAFRECLSLSWKNPYVLRLAFSAGIGGLLFGYDTGVISGAILYIRDDFKAVDRKTWLQAPGTWRWMLGVAAVPAVLQIVLMLMLPESPRWLFRKGREEEGKALLRRIYPPQEAEAEINTLRESVELEKKEAETSDKISIIKMLKTKTVRRGLYAGTGLPGGNMLFNVI